MDVEKALQRIKEAFTQLDTWFKDRDGRAYPQEGAWETLRSTILFGIQMTADKVLNEEPEENESEKLYRKLFLRDIPEVSPTSETPDFLQLMGQLKKLEGMLENIKSRLSLTQEKKPIKVFCLHCPVKNLVVCQQDFFSVNCQSLLADYRKKL